MERKLKNNTSTDVRKKIVVKNINDCVGDADLTFGYRFSIQYFGRGIGEGFEKCDN